MTSKTLKSLYAFGRSSTTRKLARRHKKIAKRELRQLCEKQGWNYKTMRHTLSGNTE